MNVLPVSAAAFAAAARWAGRVVMLPVVVWALGATIDAIAERLTDERGLVYRYRAEGGVDGLAGGPHTAPTLELKAAPSQ